MAIDLLSEALSLVRLTGALMFRLDITGPWGIAGHPTVEKFAPLLPHRPSRIIAFHLLLEGTCSIRCGRDEWQLLEPGQVVILTQGDAHDLCDRPGRRTMPLMSMLKGRSLADLRHARLGSGNGTKTSLLCGFLGCDDCTLEPLCHALPAMFRIALGKRMDTLVRYALMNALDDSPGAEGLRIRLAELLFLGALRQYVRDLPADATGWLAGLRDPVVRQALQAMHAQPCQSWSVEDLAATTNCCRSVLAERFRKLVGEPPMHYLAGLRMRMAARKLDESRDSMMRVAEQVGYESSAAFQRAFKRYFGLPPAAWRRQASGIAASERTPQD